jgi:hypothetical protein
VRLACPVYNHATYKNVMGKVLKITDLNDGSKIAAVDWDQKEICELVALSNLSPVVTPSRSERL